MATYNKETINNVLHATDIVDVVGRAVELKPASGGRFVALCPFHHEKTPSFTVSRDRQAYHCFGCGKGGDAISFLREFDGLSFTEAVHRLAEDAGIRLEAESPRGSGEDRQRARLLEVNSFAAKYFVNTLRDPLKGGEGRRYLNARNLREETLERFGLGYAVDAWSALTDAARVEGYDERLLEASGLVRRGDQGSCYDFFRNRLMVPIRDTSGRVVAFGGRDLGGESQAKYINTPENAVYKKGRILYGLYEAREALRKTKRAILVEGYFDLLRPFDVGIENVVATCGTALTPDQARLLHRYVTEVVIVYDGDRAGIQAAIRGVSVLTSAGLSVRALTLPQGQDPDDFIKAEGSEAFCDLVDSAPDFVTFYVEMSRDRLGSIEGRTSVARELFAILTSLDDELRREEYLKRMADTLNLNEWSVRSEYQKTLRRTARQLARREEESAVSGNRICQDECDFLAAIMSIEPFRAKAARVLEKAELLQGPMVEALMKVLAGAGPESVHEFESDEARSLYTAAANQPAPEAERAEKLVEKRLARLLRDGLVQESAHIQEAIRQADSAHNSEHVMELLAQKMSIDKRIQELGAT